MKSRMQNIAVIGAGAWGTALAQNFARGGRDVTLYARDAGLAKTIAETRINKTYLSGIPLLPAIVAVSDLSDALRAADLVVLATPAQFLRSLLKEMRGLMPAHVPVVNTAKGLELASGSLLSAVVAEYLPDHPYAVLSGPTFAHEVAAGLPAAATLATRSSHDDAMHWARALSSKTFRPYLSSDVAGVEVAGALKNVVAIACGIVHGRKLGENAKAAVMTRGLAEICRFGMSLGAHAETFLGLSGVGDMNLTCHSMASRNFSLGAALGGGKTLPDILAERRSVAEGVATAAALAARARRDVIHMPICAAVDEILHGTQGIDAVITGLMSRALTEEAI